MLAFLKKYNTLRNQIFLIFSVVSLLVIVIITAVSYIKFSSFYKDALERQLVQTSIEVNSAIDAKYNQISTIAAQLVTDEDIQKVMYDLQEQKTTPEAQHKMFKRVLQRYYPYVDSIYDYRFYRLNGEAIYPRGNALQRIVTDEAIRQARQVQGKLVWINSPNDRNRFSYALKVIRLIDHNYSYSGILVLRLKNDYFNTQFENDKNFIQVYDATHQLITGQATPSLLTYNDRYISIDDERFHVVKSVSNTTNWTIVVAQSLMAYKAEMSQIKTFLFWTATAMIIVSFLLSWYFSSYMTKPLHRLITKMKTNPQQKLSYIDETRTSIEMYTLHHTYNEFVIAIEQLIKEVYEKQLLQQHTELKALQSQINPHFLYNTLNAFYWQLIAEDNEKIADDILAMSELFKYSITTSPTLDDFVTLEEEINHIQHYLQLMKMRIGDRLTLQVAIAPELSAVKIPKLLLQPLVENAIVHGIEPQRTDAFIRICATSIDDEHMMISIQNNGKTIPVTQLQRLNTMTESFKNDHVGVDNIRWRLKLHYSEQIARMMQFTSDDNTYTTVKITLLKEIPKHDNPSITR